VASTSTSTRRQRRLAFPGPGALFSARAGDCRRLPSPQAPQTEPEHPAAGFPLAQPAAGFVRSAGANVRPVPAYRIGHSTFAAAAIFAAISVLSMTPPNCSAPGPKAYSGTGFAVWPPVEALLSCTSADTTPALALLASTKPTMLPIL